MVHDPAPMAWDNTAVSTERRLLLVLLVVLALAVPAAVLRALCVGESCQRATQSRTTIPYCSLPAGVRTLIANGFRDGRSPHVLAVTGETEVQSDGVGWPRAAPDEEGIVPLAFAGTEVVAGASVPDGTTLDAIAPTVAEAIGLRRAHPGVRSGQAVAGLAGGSAPRVVLVVVWKGVGARDLRQEPRAWPELRALLRDGAGTLGAEVGSLPLDPAAVLATIGTGGLPRDHGITGSLVRNDVGEVVEPWGPRAPFSVIAALGDDLDERLGQQPRIGVVGGRATDRGLIGGNWYVQHDRDDVAFPSRLKDQVRAAQGLLDSGYGRDEVPDLLAVAVEGRIEDLDQALGRLVEAADRAADGRALVVVTATGSAATGSGTVPAGRVETDIERTLEVDAVEATAVGGVFVDQDVLAETGLSVDRVVSAMREIRSRDGTPVLADVFPSIAVTFARYC
jgi:hypothetical protein